MCIYIVDEVQEDYGLLFGIGDLLAHEGGSRLISHSRLFARLPLPPPVRILNSPVAVSRELVLVSSTKSHKCTAISMLVPMASERVCELVVAPFSQISARRLARMFVALCVPARTLQ